MRLLIIVLLVLMLFGLVAFMLMNLDPSVDVALFNKVYHEVPVYLLVVLSMLVAGLVVGIIAVAEGANIRLANRRLRKEIHQLETEINYLRTQPPAVTHEQPALPEPSATASRTLPEQRPAPREQPDYGAEETGWSSDDV